MVRVERHTGTILGFDHVIVIEGWNTRKAFKVGGGTYDVESCHWSGRVIGKVIAS